MDHYDTSDLNVNAARRISEALSDVKVVDPACGSGAYLLGMMQELIELQTALYNAGADAKALYELKLEVIQRNLYGVDIDKFAVNIAMLRMWLSLAIDYEGEKPEPLPNLDFKVICGDSLLGPDPSAGVEVQGTLGQDAGQMQHLGRIKADYMLASPGPDKNRLKEDIEDAAQEVRESLGGTGVAEGTVDWRVEFVEVFASNRGFDIAIANPPYVQLQKDGGRFGRLYQDCGYATFARRGDIYQLFYERGCQLLKPSRGLLAYITSNSWLRAEYGRPLRRYFSERQTPLLLIELGRDVFESAIVDSGILMLREGGQSQAFRAIDIDRLEAEEFPPGPDLWGQVQPDGDAPWSILSHAEQSVMRKMQAKGTPLKNWDVKINRGVITGYNKAFIIDDKTKEALVSQDPKSDEIIKPVLRGRDIQRFRSAWADQWLIVAKFGSHRTLREEFPAIYKHLLQHEDKLKARGQCRYSRSGSNSQQAGYPGQHHWLELDNNPKDGYLQEFAKEKLLWIELVENGRFAYDDSGIYGEASTFMMTGESLKFLCAVLNSTITRWYLEQVAPTSGMGTLRWKKVYVESIPVPNLTTEQQRPFVRLVDKILESKDADTSNLERDLDRLVYDLYGLTEEEDTAVERSVGLVHTTDEEEDTALLRGMLEAREEMQETGERGSLDELTEIIRGWDESGP